MLEENKELQYVISDYYVNGEGRIIAMMATFARPINPDDYAESPAFAKVGGNFVFNHGKLLNTASERALREFKNEFEDRLVDNAEVVSKEKFLTYKDYIPEFVYNFVNENEMSSDFNWKSKVHINYS